MNKQPETVQIQRRPLTAPAKPTVTPPKPAPTPPTPKPTKPAKKPARKAAHLSRQQRHDFDERVAYQHVSKSGNGWGVSIKLAGRIVSLGRYPDPHEAAKAYIQASHAFREAWESYRRSALRDARAQIIAEFPMLAKAKRQLVGA